MTRGHPFSMGCGRSVSEVRSTRLTREESEVLKGEVLAGAKSGQQERA